MSIRTASVLRALSAVGRSVSAWARDEECRRAARAAERHPLRRMIDRASAKYFCSPSKRRPSSSAVVEAEASWRR